MKRNYIISAALLLFVILVMSFSQSRETKFYYAYNEKINLNEIDNKLIVRYKVSKKSDTKQISSELGIDNNLMDWKDDSTCVIVVEPIKMGEVKNKILKQADVKTLNIIYSINSGLEMGVTDEFVVKFNEGVSQKEIDKLHKKYGITILKTTDIYQLLKVPDKTDALEIANKYQESGLTLFSHPNFICDIELNQSTPNDPYFVNQYSLNNTGQVFTDGHSGTYDADIDALEAWGITKGSSSITIAVIDQGLTSNHPDLPNTRQVRLNGSNFADGNVNDPSATYNNNHGNACAGIIGATQNNNQGITGIAPNCKIMPIRVFNNDGSGIASEGLAAAINFARQNGAHIISNSWSYNSDNPNLFPVIRTAIVTATTQGRNNLGCVVVFAAGNNFANNGIVHFPSNVDVNGVLTVGASDRYDQKAYYSPLSDPNSPNNQIIDLVAPSHRAYSFQIPNETFEAWSIDIPNNAGYNPVKATDGGNLPVVNSLLPNSGTNYQSYTGRFGGTSYSCPQVAGVAALLLSIAPNLTQQEVFDILINSTDKVGGYTYTNGFSNELGYGRLNAFKALKTLELMNSSITVSDFICYSGTTASVQNAPVGSTITWSGTNISYPYGNTGTSVTVRAIYSSTSAQGTINATINLNGVTHVVTKQVWVGPPSPNELDIQNSNYDGQNFVVAGENNVLWATTKTYDIDEYVMGIDDYDWEYGTGWDHFEVEDKDMVSIVYVPPGSSGYVVVSLRAHNNCGEGYWHYEYYPIESYYSFSISPNPTYGEVTISINSDNTDEGNLKSTSTETSLNSTEEWDLEIFDFMNNQKLKKINLKDKSININTASWKAGIYIIRVNYKGEIFTGKLLVVK